METRQVVETDFAELSDGSLVELIEDPADATRTLFALCTDHSVDYIDKVVDGNRILVPLPKSDEYLRYVCLPAGVELIGQMHELIRAIGDIFTDCLDLDLDSRDLMSAFTISTWFAEKLTVAPYLALVGPPGSGKTTAMLILSSLVYRGLLTTDISSRAFYDISARIHPTVLLDETLTAGRPRELIHLLKASSTRGFACLRKDSARLAFGPKVFSWLELPDDQALNSRSIIIPMRKTWRTDFDKPDSLKIAGRVRRLRMRLLQLRFARFRNKWDSNILHTGSLSGRPLDLYRALALPLNDDVSFCKHLALKISEQDRLQSPSLSPLQVSTIDALYRFIHAQPGESGISLSDLVVYVNQNLECRGETFRMNERKLGSILTSLSFTSRTRQNNGYFLWLDREDRERINRAAYDYFDEGLLGVSIRVSEPEDQPGPSRRQVEPQKRTEGRSNRGDRVPRVHCGSRAFARAVAPGSSTRAIARLLDDNAVRAGGRKK